MDKDQGFRRILLATDGTEQAEAAVDSTIELARFTPATVRVLHIWNLEVHHRHWHWDIEARSEAEKLLQDSVDRLTAAGVTADKQLYRADSDHVAEAIALIARDFAADLLVVGSRGLSDWKSIFNHSVSHHVMAAADCPVLVVRGHALGARPGTRKILIAVAGGDDVGPAVRAAIAVAQTGECVVRVIHVAQAILGMQGFAYIEPDEEIQATLRAAVKLLASEGIAAVSTVTPAGPVAKALAEVAAGWNADLIVMGSSRMGDLTSLLLGSVSHELLGVSEIPVLIAARMT
jgi:nucleotide-binding universal stress UspA family protein